MAAQKQPAVRVADFSDINWSSQPAALHHRHGSNTRLSENNSVAERVKGWDDGVVMTAEPVSVGTVFQVTVLEKVGGFLGSLVSVVIDLTEHLSLVQKLWFMTISQQFSTWKTWNKNSFQQQGSQLQEYQHVGLLEVEICV